MSTKAPLQNVIATELGSRISAGVCGTILAQLGATVVVPEGEHRKGGKRKYRAQFMAGKRSLVLDMREANDVELRKRLIRRSDLLILSSDVDGKRSCLLQLAVGSFPRRL